ncbi:MAG: hypothetical protein K2L49_04660 [Muribaculaceae bacterium]|nr:hypothetical protein [Muribaculaceae bacterium]
MRLYLFNPENDTALASGRANYTPTAAVRSFHDAGACLPLWYADSGACAVVAPDVSREWLERRNREFGTDCHVMLAGMQVDGVEPWGWSADAVRQMRSAGALPALMPDDATLSRYRGLSHRRTAARLLEELRGEMGDYLLPDRVFEAFDTDSVSEFLNKCDGRVYMKSPWSSSGRGVVDCSVVPARQVLRQAEGIIKRQGSVMLERRLDKVRDFAVLYRCRGGEVGHLGYSLFYNDGVSAYGGNIILPDTALRSIIGADVGEELISCLTMKVADVLTRLIGGIYEGYLGVDMMIYRDSSGVMRVAPAVEVNLRTTMGVVAWHLGRRFIADGCKGVMSVSYRHEISCVPENYIIDGGRLVGGTINLVPPGSRFDFSLTVTAGS